MFFNLKSLKENIYNKFFCIFSKFQNTLFLTFYKTFFITNIISNFSKNICDLNLLSFKFSNFTI